MKKTEEKPIAEKQVKAPKKLRLIQHMEEVVKLSKDSKLSDECFAKCKPHTTAIAEKLGLTEPQALLLSVFIDQSDNEGIRIADLASHFNCRNINVMSYSEDIDTLVAIGYIRRSKCPYIRQITCRVPDEVVKAIKKGESYEAPAIKNLSTIQLFDALHRFYDEAESGELTLEELSAKVQELIDENPDLNIVKRIDEYCLTEDENTNSLTILLYFCHYIVNHDDDDMMFYQLEKIYNMKHQFHTLKREFKKGHHELMGRELIRSKKGADLVERDVYCLTDKAKENLLADLDLKLDRQKLPPGIMKCTEVAPKELFYNQREQAQIGQLTSLLGPDNFRNVQQRLSENGMRKGVACLFYGAPGTGKTETVYQIARQTGRDIMTVNVSEIKSMWVGESEKNIKALFDRYRNFCKQSARTPILLFNEADAVIGIRQEGAERAVDKMENSIQNIILQEMEVLDGIMIATTNLTQNLDKAFERRFLYKIEFDKPAIEAKRAIWRTMMPALSEAEAAELACAYEFSGGQIENIARKRTVETIINGAEPSLDALHAFCQSEQLTKTGARRRIGF